MKPVSHSLVVFCALSAGLVASVASASVRTLCQSHGDFSLRLEAEGEDLGTFDCLEGSALEIVFEETEEGESVSVEGEEIREGEFTFSGGDGTVSLETWCRDWQERSEAEREERRSLDAYLHVEKPKINWPDVSRALVQWTFDGEASSCSAVKETFTVSVDRIEVQ